MSPFTRHALENSERLRLHREMTAADLGLLSLIRPHVDGERKAPEDNALWQGPTSLGLHEPEQFQGPLGPDPYAPYSFWLGGDRG